MILFRGVSLLQRIWNKLVIFIFGSRGTVYVFHEVDDVNRNGTPSSCFCSKKAFEEFIYKNRDSIVSIQNLLVGRSANQIVVTFDDVPESVFKNAYPILKRENIPFLLFVSTRFIGEEGFLKIEQLKEMASNPLCTVGAHTMNHTKLRYENDSYQDLLDSKNELESLLGKPVSYLAYPFGRSDAVSLRNREEAKKCGYKLALCTIPTRVPLFYDKWYVPRVFLN